MKALKKPLSMLLALLMCFGVFSGMGITAFAAGEEMTPQRRPAENRLGPSGPQPDGRLGGGRKQPLYRPRAGFL